MLGAHDVIGAAIGLARDDRQLGHGGLGIGEQQLGAVLDQGAVLLLGARHEARHVHQRHQRNVEGVAEADEARGLAAAVDVQHPRQNLRLVGDDADGLAVQTTEAADDVPGEVGADLEEVGLVDHLQDQLLHVVGLVRIGRDQGVQRGLVAIRLVIAVADRRLFAVRQGQEADQAADLGQGLQIILEGAVGDPRLAGVDAGAAQVLMADDLVGDGLHHVRAGHVHVGRVLHHEDEVGDGGRIDVAARARAHDDRDLRDDARGQGVLQEDVGVTGQALDAFLNARAARIEQADDRRARRQGHLLDLDDLGRVSARQGAAEDGEVFREDIDQTAADGAASGDDAVARDALLGHAEVVAAMLHEHVGLFEAAFVQQDFDPFARGQLALGVLGGDALFTTAQFGGGATAFKLLEDGLAHGLGCSL
ncbi:hypothetical protein D3C86_1240470 [compost metagenome]